MVKVVHSLKGDRISKEVRKAPCFLLTNRLGGFAYFGDRPQSRFQGLFFNKNFEMYKTIESLELGPKITGIHNRFCEVETKRGKISETFFMPLRHNSLFYKIMNYRGDLVLNLDCKKIYDKDNWGREYIITCESNRVVIEYEKEGAYRTCLVISSDKEIHFERVGEWKRREYKLHTANDPSPERHVYSALKLKIKGGQLFIFTFALGKDEALRDAGQMLENAEALRKEREGGLFHSSIAGDKEQRMAYNATQNSLKGLLADVGGKVGVYAGLPWFFHFWTRDEMISLKALGKSREARKILERSGKGITKEGKIPNRIPSFGTAADGIGWYYKRRGGDAKLKGVIRSLLENSTIDGFAISRPHETWMDDLERDGIRIEVQALRLGMYGLAGERMLERKLRQDVRENLWNGKTLADGLGDSTIRPNIFLAAYIYPMLLSRQEWVECFKNALPKLWNKWGGLSTVDKASPHYIGTTAEGSYHNGNSWFYLNNLAALVLHKIGGFEKYVGKVLEASSEDILWSGMVGHHSEISPSERLESAGCGCQAWSNAMFIELIEGIATRK